MEENPRKPRSFQFTIRNLLWATFWLALAVGAFCYPQRSIKSFTIGLATEAGVPVIVVLCVCAAIGALLNRQRWGIAIGCIMAMGALASLGVFVACDKWHHAMQPPPTQVPSGGSGPSGLPFPG